jgi:hypothetical protein
MLDSGFFTEGWDETLASVGREVEVGAGCQVRALLDDEPFPEGREVVSAHDDLCAVD